MCKQLGEGGFFPLAHKLHTQEERLFTYRALAGSNLEIWSMELCLSAARHGTRAEALPASYHGSCEAGQL